MKRVYIDQITADELSSIITDGIRAEFKNFPTQSTFNPKGLYGTRKEVANSLHISLPTLNQLTKTGAITGYRLKGRVLYKWSEVDEALEEISALKYSRVQ